MGITERNLRQFKDNEIVETTEENKSNRIKKIVSGKKEINLKEKRRTYIQQRKI